jgi:hypothetical protein
MGTVIVWVPCLLENMADGATGHDHHAAEDDGLEILLRRFRQIAVFALNGGKTKLFQSLTLSRFYRIFHDLTGIPCHRIARMTVSSQRVSNPDLGYNRIGRVLFQPASLFRGSEKTDRVYDFASVSLRYAMMLNVMFNSSLLARLLTFGILSPDGRSQFA